MLNRILTALPKIRKAVTAAVAAYAATVAGGFLPDGAPPWGIYVLAGVAALVAGAGTYFAKNAPA